MLLTECVRVCAECGSCCFIGERENRKKGRRSLKIDVCIKIKRCSSQKARREREAESVQSGQRESGWLLHLHNCCCKGECVPNIVFGSELFI